MTTSETKETLVNIENLCDPDPQKFNRHKMWPFWDMSNVAIYATENGILIADQDDLYCKRSPSDIELCKVPSWIHHNEVDYILNHKRLNKVAQELVLLSKKEKPLSEIRNHYDDLYAEAQSILSNIISKLDNKYLISSEFLEQDIRKHIEKNQGKYKTPLEFIEAFIRDLLVSKPFRWYGFYYNDGTIRPLTINDFIDVIYDV